MPTANEKLADAAISHSVDLQQYSNAEVRKMVALLNRVDADLSDRLVKAVRRMGTERYTVTHMNSILESVRELNASIYAEIGEAMTQAVTDLAEYEIAYQQTLFETTIPAPVLAYVALERVSLSQVRNAALSRPFQGRLLKEWLKDIEATRAERIRDAIRMGVVSGQTTDEIVRGIVGIKSEGYADGLLHRSRRDIESVVRTAISHTAETARDAFYEANADLISAVTWLSAIDARTTPECRIRDGLKYTADTHQPIGHAVPWLAGPGRIHWCCRSASTSVLKGWAELGLSPDDIDEGTRATMDGQIPANKSYAEWLPQQSAARQDEILGPTRGKLMREGGLKMDRFYNDKGIYLDLDQLRERDAAAFARAGL